MKTNRSRRLQPPAPRSVKEVTHDRPAPAYGKAEGDPIRPDRVERPEWAAKDSEALVADIEGYQLEIGRGVDNPRTWDWMIRTTAEVSETPEVIAAGVGKSKSGAQYACKENSNQYRLKEWQRRRGIEPKAKAAPKPKPAPKAKPVPKMPTEAEMETARKFLADQLPPPNKRRRPRGSEVGAV